MLNLISNSLKFTEDNGKIEVDIKVNKEEEKLYIHVKKNGPSKAKEDEDRIYSSYVEHF